MDKDVDKALKDIQTQISELANRITELQTNVSELRWSKDDMLYGASAVMVDLYWLDIQSGHLSKEDVIIRLEARKNWIGMNVPGQPGVQFLDYLIGALQMV